MISDGKNSSDAKTNIQNLYPLFIVYCIFQKFQVNSLLFPFFLKYLQIYKGNIDIILNNHLFNDEIAVFTAPHRIQADARNTLRSKPSLH